ncbi:hypothetical protein D3C81_1685070 [compost metagenome]
MGEALAVQPVAKEIESVEHQEVSAEQHQLVGEFEVRDVGGVAGLERLDQLVFAQAFRRPAQEFVELVAEVQGGVEVAVHRREPSTG